LPGPARFPSLPRRLHRFGHHLSCRCGGRVLAAAAGAGAAATGFEMSQPARIQSGKRDV
jgi:hypothetical protein